MPDQTTIKITRASIQNFLQKSTMFPFFFVGSFRVMTHRGMNRQQCFYQTEIYYNTFEPIILYVSPKLNLRMFPWPQ